VKAKHKKDGLELPAGIVLGIGGGSYQGEIPQRVAESLGVTVESGKVLIRGKVVGPFDVNDLKKTDADGDTVGNDGSDAEGDRKKGKKK